MIRIIKDIDLIWETEDYDVILVGTNIYCSLGNGFQSKMRFKYRFIEEEDDKTPYGDHRKLGTRLTLDKQTPIISLLYFCKYTNRTRETIDWEAFENCLKTANAEFRGKKVATTILGSSPFDGNADKEKCLKLIEKYMTDVDLTLYDYEQKHKQKEIKPYEVYVYKMRKSDKELGKKLFKEKDEYLRQRYLIY